MICLRCFQYKGSFDVCPYCGFEAGTPPLEAYFLHPGMVLKDRYVIGTVLGYGGFGVTYKAYDTNLGMVLAVKEFFPGALANRIPGEKSLRVFPGDSRQGFDVLRARFLEEARNLAKFNGNSRIVNVYDYFEENGTAYIAMEFLDGQTLKEYLAVVGGRLPEEDVLRIAGGLLDGLSSIHEQGIIHRDISPDNVFMVRDGRVKILDFGAAKFAGGQDAPEEGKRAAVIKVGYTPPEQYHTKTEQGAWTDIYAVGATLYRLATGQTPAESVDRAERDDVKRPSRLGVSLSPHVDKAIMTAMALDPAQRYPSAQRMKAVLERREKAAYPEEKARRRNALWLAAAALLVVIFLAVLLLLLPGRGEVAGAAPPGTAGAGNQNEAILARSRGPGEYGEYALPHHISR